jgi:hypothetical protein
VNLAILVQDLAVHLTAQVESVPEALLEKLAPQALALQALVLQALALQEPVLQELASSGPTMTVIRLTLEPSLILTQNTMSTPEPVLAAKVERLRQQLKDHTSPMSVYPFEILIIFQLITIRS